jgi:hypothetical protein
MFGRAVGFRLLGSEFVESEHRERREIFDWKSSWVQCGKFGEMTFYCAILWSF